MRAKMIFLGVALIGVMALMGFVISSGSSESLTGATVSEQVSCYSDADCSDKIDCTQDICRNPGSEYSLCINRAIENC